MADEQSAVVHGCYCDIRQLRAIRNSLTRPCQARHTTDTISNRLLRCAVHELGCLIASRVQTFMNMAVRIVSGRSCFINIKAHVGDYLHWLPAL